MRVPKVEHYGNDHDNIKYVELQAPILIPRHPVITGVKQRTKVIKQIEKKCRTSLEYKDLIKYLRTNVHMNECAFLPNIKATTKSSGLIQIHHAPFDLFSIVDIVMSKFDKENGYINTNLIAKEVMELHYSGMVGLIPLSVTVHELVHDGKLIVPLNCVYGRFVEFTQKYFEYIDNDMMSVLEDNIELTKKMTRKDLSILDTQYIYTLIPNEAQLDTLDLSTVTDVTIRPDYEEAA